MALDRKWKAVKSKQVRRREDGSAKQGCGDDRHMLVGSTGSGKDQWNYRSLVRFTPNWNEVARVVKMEIAVRVEDDSSHWGLGSKPRVRAGLNGVNFAEGYGAENVWTSAEYEWPSMRGSYGPYVDLPINPNTGLPQDEAWVFIDVTNISKPIVPSGVEMPDGTRGGGKTDYGYFIKTYDTYDNKQRAIFYSMHATDPAKRPYLLLTYDPKNRNPVAPTLQEPPTSGTVTFADSFVGTHSDPDGDPMAARVIRITNKATGEQWWLPETLQSAGSDESQTGVFSVPLTHAAAFLKLGTAYEWDAKTKDSRGLWGPYSARRNLTITSSAPTVVPSTYSPLESMANVKLGGTYSDPEGDPLAVYHLQVKAQAVVGWDDPLLLSWNTGEVSATVEEITSGVIARQYAGKTLVAGIHDFRVRAQDSTGVWSPWAEGSFELTADFNPDLGAIDFTTMVQRNAPVRIELRRMAADRGPGDLIGWIDDPMNLGASAYLNGPGEVYFSLPALHPYCPEIEPHHTHYAVQQYYGDRYRTLFAGVITDFDAVADEMVAFGTDYIGLLQTAVDERYNPDKPELTYDKGGSKYVNVNIDTVIRDQLTYHKGLSNSTTKFIQIGGISALAERVTIYSTYTQALPFIIGLIDSHKQGTGREARFYAIQRASDGKWEWRLTDNWGRDRKNIRLEFGSLVNDFRVVALGDFATRVPAIGQKRGEVKVYRALGVSGLDEAEWGRTAQPRFYQDINDLNDLKRRAKEAAVQMAKVGKRMAIAIPANALTPFDGWDLGDNIVIDIERGVVDTSRYGSSEGLPTRPDGRATGGFWTIYGVEWRYYPDSHTDLTLTILPKKTDEDPDPDLIPSYYPGPTMDWQVGYGEPSSYGEPPNPTPPPATVYAPSYDYGDWEATWRFEHGTTPPPAAGKFKADSNTIGSPATHLFISKFDQDGIDRSVEMRTIHKNARVTIRPVNGSGYYLATVLDDPVEGIDYFDLHVQRESSPQTVLPANNTPCLISLDVSRVQPRDFVPPSTEDVIARRWTDLNTGCVYEWDGYPADTYSKVYCPPTSDGGGGQPPDTTPPDTPSILTLTSEYTEYEDGTSAVRITAEVGYPVPPGAMDDLSVFHVQATYHGLPDDLNSPDWTYAIDRIVPASDPTGATSAFVSITPVQPVIKYWVRASAEDRSGNRSGYCTPVEIITARDDEGPPRPEGIILVAGNETVGIRTDPSSAVDWSYNEIRWRPVGDPDWRAPVRAKSTVFVIVGFTNDVTYEFQMRAVDTSGNTVHDTGAVDPEGNPIYETVLADSEPDKGWVNGGTATPTPLLGTDLVWTSAIIEEVFAGEISADWISSGSISVGAKPGTANGIFVYNAAGQLVGSWTENGIRVLDPANSQYELAIDEASLTVWDRSEPSDPIARVRITPMGIDAASITFGSARGGHNLIPNSSFELGKFGVTAVTTYTWAAAADWNASRVGSDTNVTTNPDDLTMTVT